jgi:hypothetical protein
MHLLADKLTGSRTLYWVRFVNGVSAEAASSSRRENCQMRKIGPDAQFVNLQVNGHAADVDYLDYH